MNSQEKQQKDIESKARRYLKENDRLLAKYNLQIRPILNIPVNKFPLILKFSLWIIGRYKASPDLQFISTK